MHQNRRKLNAAILLTMIMAGTFFFGGCQSNQAPTGTEMNQPLDRRIGIIRSLGGVKTSNKGTHLLQQDDGSTILVKSLMINLDDPQYLNKNVEVRGIVTYTTDQKQIMEVENIDLVEGGLSQQSSLPQWKDYSNNDLGLNMRYKDDLKMSENANNVTFERRIQPKTDLGGTIESSEVKPVIHTLVIARKSYSGVKTLVAELSLKSDSYNDLMAKGMVKSQIGSDNYQAIKKTDGTSTNYYINGTDGYYEIAMDCGQDEQTLADQNLFYEMLGTLKIKAGTASNANSNEADISNNETETEDILIETTQENTDPATSEKEIEKTEPAAAISTQAVIEEPAEDLSATQQAITGYQKMESSSFKFSVQYPKSWFYAGSASSDSGVIRHYEFGTKPIEENPGQVAFDLVSGTMPSGSTVNAGSNSAIQKESGGSVEIYVKGSGSRIYKITGPSSMESTLLNIAGSIEEL